MQVYLKLRYRKIVLLIHLASYNTDLTRAGRSFGQPLISFMGYRGTTGNYFKSQGLIGIRLKEPLPGLQEEVWG